jgi:geranylgeranyl pyrophosphate synthase
LRDLILNLPQTAQWPKLADLFPSNEGAVTRLDWLLPGIGCAAAGGALADTLPAMAALACAQRSIILIDDMLDEEPDGRHHQLGVGRTANLAAALQAAGVLLIEQCPVSLSNRSAAALSFNQMILDTAAGQELDVSNLTGEENYWQLVRAKSTPFYGAGLEMGALLGGAPAAVARELYNVGVLFGEAVQILDDLEDAFKTPANPDWLRGRNNLAILYGLTADYPRKRSFIQLMNQVEDADILYQAQQLLIESGAVSYCTYQLLERYRTIRHSWQALSLAQTSLLDRMLTIQFDPFLYLLARLNTQLPVQFLFALQGEKEEKNREHSQCPAFSHTSGCGRHSPRHLLSLLSGSCLCCTLSRI